MMTSILIKTEIVKVVWLLIYSVKTHAWVDPTSNCKLYTRVYLGDITK